MRKLAIFTLSFTAAVAAILWLPSPLWLVVPCCAALLFAVPFASGRRLASRIAAFGLVFGFLWTFAFDVVVFRPAEALTGNEEEATLRICAYPETTDTGVRIKAQLGRYRTLLYLYGDSWDALSPGDTLSGTFRVRAPGDDSFGRYLLSEGYALVAYPRGTPTICAADLSALRDLPAHCAHFLAQKLDAVFPQDVAPFLHALLLGDRTEISEEMNNALIDSGVVHIISVSGAHVSMLASLVLWLCFRRRRIAAVITIVVCAFFTAVVGFPPSAVRALFMLTVSCLAPIFHREQDAPTTICFALLVQLLWNPFALASVSLQLSYAAVTGIAAYARPLYLRMTARLPKAVKRAYLRPLCALYRSAALTLSVTLSANVFTCAISALNFQSVSLISPVTNLLTMPLFSLAFPLGICALLLGLFVPAAARILGHAVALPIRLALHFTQALSNVSLAAIPMKEPVFALWLLCSYLLLLAFFVFGRRNLLRFASCVALMLCICIAAVRFGQKDILFTAFDVGQGQCLLCESDGVRVMIDCGGDTDGRELARSLLARGKGRIDALILTHFDEDHCGAVQSLLSLADVQCIFVPTPSGDGTQQDEILSAAQARGVRVVTVSEDLTLYFGDGRVQIFAPLGSAARNNGLAVLFTQEEFDILVTGDLPQVQERLLLSTHLLPDIELLVAGHHGAKTSTCAELLSALRPEIAIISVGDNSYGHPTPEVLERLKEADVQVLRTDELGEIRIRR